MATFAELITYIKEGNEQAVKNSVIARNTGNTFDSFRWAGKSHAYMDVLAFIENEMPEVN